MEVVQKCPFPPRWRGARNPTTNEEKTGMDCQVTSSLSLTQPDLTAASVADVPTSRCSAKPSPARPSPPRCFSIRRSPRLGCDNSSWPTYRTRFGIESSDRQMNQARGRTSTQRPELRLLYVGTSLVLRNERVWLHFAGLSTPRRCGRPLRFASVENPQYI
jgi:hypothetical protein